MKISVVTAGVADAIPEDVVIYASVEASQVDPEEARKLQAARMHTVKGILNALNLEFSSLSPATLRGVTSQRVSTAHKDSAIISSEVSAYRCFQYAEICLHGFTAEKLAEVTDNLSLAAGGDVSVQFILSERQRRKLREDAVAKSFNEAVACATQLRILAKGCESLSNTGTELYLQSAFVNSQARSNPFKASYLECEGSMFDSAASRAEVTAPVCAPIGVSVSIDYTFDTKDGESE